MNDQQVVDELERISEEHNGELKPEDVVEEARLAGSPLHDRFQWDDTICGREYRLLQARKLISYVMTRVGDETNSVPVRLYWSLSTDRQTKGGGYRTISTIMSKDETRQQLLADAQKEMDHFADKFSSLRELASVFDAMNEVKQRLQKKPVKRQSRAEMRA